MTKAKRLGKRETAAKEFCERVRESTFPYPFRMVWSKSPTWGYCPKVKTNGGEVLAHVTGCGFDKESAALAEVLYWLPAPPDSFEATAKIRGASCAGFRAVQDACLAAGYELLKVYDGEAENGYTVQPIGLAEAEVES